MLILNCSEVFFYGDEKYRSDALKEISTTSEKSNNKFFQLFHSVMVDNTSPTSFLGHNIQFEDTFLFAELLFRSDNWDACITIFNRAFTFFAHHFETCARLFEFVLVLHPDLFSTYLKVADYVLFKLPFEAKMEYLNQSLRVISQLKSRAKQFPNARDTISKYLEDIRPNSLIKHLQETKSGLEHLNKAIQKEQLVNPIDNVGSSQNEMNPSSLEGKKSPYKTEVMELKEGIEVSSTH